MNLTKIIIKDVRADKARDFIKALEELPSEVIQGDKNLIEAYKNPITDLNNLVVLYGNKKERRLIRFRVPGGSKNAKISDDKVEFEYNNQAYKLEKVFSWSP